MYFFNKYFWLVRERSSSEFMSMNDNKIEKLRYFIKYLK